MKTVIKQYLDAHEHLPPPDVQQSDILDELLNELFLQSMEELMERAVFRHLKEDDPTLMLRLEPAYRALQKLRVLHSARLCQAIRSSIPEG